MSGCREFVKKGTRSLRYWYADNRARRYFALLPPDREFRPDGWKDRVAAFVDALRTDASGIRYVYSALCSEPTLYASVYACMIHSLLGLLSGCSPEKKRAWADYFDSFQHAEDGLFYDPAVRNSLYDDSDWWGARHLALHMVIAYTALGAVPRHPFGFLRAYYEPAFVERWLDGFDWSARSLGDDDVDNRIMNVGGLLQYQRDIWGDRRAGEAVEHLKRYLLSRLNPKSGLWGSGELDDPFQRSRMVQFAYHLLPLFFFDGFYDFDIVKIVETALATQNELGGYGVRLNSSACEDIDSLDILLRFDGRPGCPEHLKSRIRQSAEKARRWILANQMKDGGFVFRLDEPFVYGHPNVSSRRNEGALFPTWFRTLSLVLIDRWQGGNDFELVSAPGYVPRFNPPRA